MSRVVITGGNRGLGLALAAAYVRRGDDVVVGVRSPSTADAARGVGAAVLAFDADSNESAVEFAHLVAQGGGVDLLINNAGVDARAFGAGERERTVLQLSPEHTLRQVQINAVAPMVLTRELVLALTATSGKVLNISSQIGSLEVSATMGSDVGYAVSKAALNMVTVKLAAALRSDGIVVAAMHPGWLQTDMGGPSASLPLDDVVPQIVATTDALTIDQTGTFVRYDGSIHPW